MIIITSAVMIKLYNNILFNSYQKRIMQYYLSLIHSCITVFLYLIDIPYIYFQTQYEIIIGIHIGYFIADTFTEYRNNNISFVIHHMFSIYYILLNYHLQSFYILQKSMLIAELSAMLYNLRSIYIKKMQKKNIYVELCFYIPYVFLRCVYCPYCIIQYVFYSYNLSYQLLYSTLLFFCISVKWSYTMGKSIYQIIKIPRIII